MSNILNHDALESAIKTLVAEKLSSEAMMEKISDTLDKTVASAIDEALRSWSPMGKSIAQAVETALQVDTDLGLPSYNETVKRLVREKVEQHVNTTGRDRLRAELDEMFNTAPDELKLSALIDEFRNNYLFKDEWESGHITLIVDEDRGYHSIYWDDGENTAKYSCEYQIQVDKEGKVFAGRFGFSGTFDDSKPIYFGKKNGFEKLIMNLYACGTRIIVDEEDCATHYGPGED